SKRDWSSDVCSSDLQCDLLATAHVPALVRELACVLQHHADAGMPPCQLRGAGGVVGEQEVFHRMGSMRLLAPAPPGGHGIGAGGVPAREVAPGGAVEYDGGACLSGHRRLCEASGCGHGAGS